LSDDILTTLENTFGFAAFRPGQEQAIHSVLAGRHALVVMPTGAGKSLIYQLASLHLTGTTLVISPLIALMKDQVDGLTAQGISATFINSSLDSNEQSRRLDALAAGSLKIAYIAPERLRSTAFLAALHSIQISLLAVDEAHCVSQWGHDFRPDYLHIAEARRTMGDPVTVALTATATPQVQDDIARLLDLPRAERIVTGFNRPNLTFEVRYTRDLEAKLKALRDLLTSADGAGIVYVGTRRDAEEVAEFARSVCGVEALYYHAGLDADARSQAQEAFLAGDVPLMVATNAFGMGIDRPDVRFVLHYALPGSLEAYYQEAGRAGRDGLPACCTLLYAPQDRALQEWFIENDAPSHDEVRALYAAIRSDTSGDTAMLTLDDLSLATGLHEVKVKVGLSQLEAVGALRRLGDAGARMHIALGELNEPALRAASNQVEARRDHKRRQLAKMIAYAEMNNCRRRAILDHFGDKSEAEAEVCCDNCLTRRETPKVLKTLEVSEPEQAERAALAVLDTVRRLKWNVGRQKLAQILKGSRAQDMTRFGYDKSIYYGRYADQPLAEIENWIDQLIEADYLKVIGGEQPTVKLTPRGQSAVKARKAIPLRLSRDLRPEVAVRKKAERDAGGTVALTGQLLAQGLTPAQIVAQRGLVESTIYSHLARLIAQGQVDVNAVVPEPVQAQIREAIERCGSAEFLAPIKALLPEHISYGEIRCVIEANKPMEAEAPSLPQESANERTRRVVKLGEAHSSAGVPELIAALDDPDGNVRRLAASALGKIRDQQAVEPLIALLMRETKPQVRQYAVKALGRLHDARAQSLLEKIANDQTEHDYTRTAARTALKGLSAPSADEGESETDIADFLSRSHPRELRGPWAAGWALDFHSRFSGADWSRSQAGELAYRYKYGGQQALVETLADQLAALIADHPELSQMDAIVPVPPSSPREFDPVSALCDALARRMNRPAQRTLVKTRVTAPQKEMRTLAQKRANVAGAFAVAAEFSRDLRGKQLLVLDDLYDSGATLEEVTRTLQRAGVTTIMALTLTRTIHADA
jgi:ATP-dependent DNA helicase RecQ